MPSVLLLRHSSTGVEVTLCGVRNEQTLTFDLGNHWAGCASRFILLYPVSQSHCTRYRSNNTPSGRCMGIVAPRSNLLKSTQAEHIYIQFAL